MAPRMRLKTLRQQRRLCGAWHQVSGGRAVQGGIGVSTSTSEAEAQAVFQLSSILRSGNGPFVSVAVKLAQLCRGSSVKKTFAFLELTEGVDKSQAKLAVLGPSSNTLWGISCFSGQRFSAVGTKSRSAMSEVFPHCLWCSCWVARVFVKSLSVQCRRLRSGCSDTTPLSTCPPPCCIGGEGHIT